MRWKNYGLWAAILAFIPLLVDALKVYNIDVILPGNYDELTKAILGILVLAGILNNPTTQNRGFFDD
jgi:uncharacterized membrane protein